MVLKDGEGTVLATGATKTDYPSRQFTTPSTKKSVAKVALSSLEKATTTEKVSVEGERGGEGIALAAETQTASLPSSDTSKEAWPYLALFAVIGLGIFTLYGTRV